jgi:protein FrlC
MKLAFHSWIYSSLASWLPSYPLDRVISEVARLGYEGIEIGAASPHAFPDYLDPADRRQIRQWLEDANLSLCCMDPAYGGGPGYNTTSAIEAERKASLTYNKACIQLAADLGCPRYVWLGGWYSYGTEEEQAWAWSREALTETAAFARDVGVTLMVEPTPADSNLIETVGDAKRLIAEVADPALRIIIDTYHVLHRKDSLVATLLEAGDLLEHVHIADLDRMWPGYATDFRPVVAVLQGMDYAGFLSMEIGFNVRTANPEAYAVQSKRYMDSILNELGGK